jgi:hypothetical protein
MSDFSGPREQQALADIGDVYVGIHTTDEGNTPDGSSEISTAGYDRQLLAAADQTISGEAPTTLTNDVVIDFGQSDADWDVSYVALWDSQTGGSPETSTVVPANAGTASTGTDVQIPAGSLEFNVD